MDYIDIGEIKYFSSDRKNVFKFGFDKQAELHKLENQIVRGKNSFMIAENQLHLLEEIGFVRNNDAVHSHLTARFLKRFSFNLDIVHTFIFSYRRVSKNKIIELFFELFEFKSDGHTFFYVNLKTFQDNSEQLGNGKSNFFYLYNKRYDAEPFITCKNVNNDFIEMTDSDPRYHYYPCKQKRYYPIDENKEHAFYLSSVSFDYRNKAKDISYNIFGKIVRLPKIQAMLSDEQLDINYIINNKGKIDSETADLIKMVFYV
jgi:hypothetical protein